MVPRPHLQAIERIAPTLRALPRAEVRTRLGRVRRPLATARGQ